jgi:hypothetical protein
MSKQTHNDQTLTRYLLGALPAAEVERLDELSFTDDGFAEALDAAEKDLVDAYVQDELTGATLERFKSHYLASPLRRDKVKFARVFQLVAEKNVGAKSLETKAEAHDESVAKRKDFWQRFSSGFLKTPRPALRWGAAFASLALVVAVGWLAFENARLRGQVSQTQARSEEFGRREQELQSELEGRRSAGALTEQELARVREERERLEQELKQREAQAAQQRATAQRPSQPGRVGIASFILAPQMRDAAQIREVSVPPDAGYVAMRLELEPNDYSAYRVALINQTGSQTFWRSGPLKARTSGDDKALSVRLRAGLLKPQTVYMLRVTGVSTAGSTEIVGDYPFRVVK